MLIELWVNSQLKRNWPFAFLNEDPSEEGFKERERELKFFIDGKKADAEIAGMLHYSETYAFVVCVKARVQPRHISAKDYQDFLEVIEAMHGQALPLK